MVDRLSELSVNYRQSPIVGQAGRWYTAGPAAGDRAVDAPMSGGGRLCELLHATKHGLLLFTGAQPGAGELRDLANIERYMREGYGDEIRTYLIARREAAWAGLKVEDPEGRIHEAYAGALACVYLIRPDGYVGFRSLSSDPLPLLEYLNRVNEPPLQSEGPDPA